MARVLFGGGVVSIKGSIGGTTFQSNTSGNIARSRPATKKRQTKNQGNQIALFGTIASLWRGLSLANKILWNDFATANPKTNKFGQVKTLTGYAMFQSLNHGRLANLNPFLDVPPVFSLPSPVLDYTVILDPLEIKVEAVNRDIDNNEHLMIYSTFPTSRNTSSNNNQMLFTENLTSFFVPPQDISRSWDNVHQLSYVAVRATGQFNIGFNFMMLNLDTGITSAGNFKTFSF